LHRSGLDRLSWSLLNATDPRSPELEAELTALDPADELADCFAYCERCRHCRNDPVWRARIDELPAQQLDLDGHARLRRTAGSQDAYPETLTCSAPRRGCPSPARRSVDTRREVGAAPKLTLVRTI
jgi:hypothetical protein